MSFVDWYLVWVLTLPKPRPLEEKEPYPTVKRKDTVHLPAGSIGLPGTTLEYNTFTGCQMDAPGDNVYPESW